MSANNNCTAEYVAVINNKVYKAKKSGNRFFYFSPNAVRWLPVACDKVKQSQSTARTIQ